MNTGPRISLVLPVYNEAETVPVLAERLRELLERLDAAGDRAEVILVDDGSTDATPELLRRACRDHPGFRALRLARNRGSHVAILAGLEHAVGDCAIFLAADLQDPPELVPDLMARWRAGNHVVWAVRAARPGEALRTRVMARLFYRVLNWVGEVNLPPSGADFALLDRKVIDALSASAGANLSLGGEIARIGFRQTSMAYTKVARHAGRSKWRLRHRLKAFADAMVSFSYTPLRLMSYAGMVFSLVGFAYALVVIGLRVMGNPTQGWASLMVVVLVLGGVQMTMLGVLGEYLWRTLGEAQNRPRYVVQEQYPHRPRDAEDPGEPAISTPSVVDGVGGRADAGRGSAGPARP